MEHQMRHRFVWRFFRPLVRLILFFRFNYRCRTSSLIAPYTPSSFSTASAIGLIFFSSRSEYEPKILSKSPMFSVPFLFMRPRRARAHTCTK